MTIRAFVVGVALLAAGPAWADSTALQNQLGALLGAEEPCGMSFDKDAVQAFVEKRVSSDDMDFASSVTMQANGQKVLYEEMSDTGKLVFCTQQKRVAKKFGFIK